MADSSSRREWLFAAGSAAAATRLARGAEAPTAPVAVAKCDSYGSALLPALERMFDDLGGLGRLVKGKTVAVKINLTGGPRYRLGHLPAELTTWTHPAVIGACVHLLGKAGARRIRILEGAAGTAEPLEEHVLRANWDPAAILGAAPQVEFENTNYLGKSKRYFRVNTPGGGYIFRGFDLNHSYEECDVFVSLAKLKEHVTTGITASMKNCFGITPCTIYGQGSGVDEPSLVPRGGRRILHNGNRQPSLSAPSENDPTTPRDDGYRVPRIVTDLVAARPIHLAVIDGIYTMTRGEGPWIQGCAPVKSGVLLAGTNCVALDAIAASVMGFDPMADRGTPPFEKCDNMLRLAEEKGIGTRDPRRIEVIGTPVKEVRLEFRRHWARLPQDRHSV